MAIRNPAFELSSNYESGFRAVQIMAAVDPRYRQDYRRAEWRLVSLFGRRGGHVLEPCQPNAK
jgi:hypothetical protein